MTAPAPTTPPQGVPLCGVCNQPMPCAHQVAAQGTAGAAHGRPTPVVLTQTGRLRYAPSNETCPHCQGPKHRNVPAAEQLLSCLLQDWSLQRHGRPRYRFQDAADVSTFLHWAMSLDTADVEMRMARPSKKLTAAATAAAVAAATALPPQHVQTQTTTSPVGGHTHTITPPATTDNTTTADVLADLAATILPAPEPTPTNDVGLLLDLISDGRNWADEALAKWEEPEEPAPPKKPARPKKSRPEPLIPVNVPAPKQRRPKPAKKATA